MITGSVHNSAKDDRIRAELVIMAVGRRSGAGRIPLTASTPDTYREVTLMPKSKVRKKAVYTPPPGEGRSRTPVKVAGPTHPVYIAVMLGLMLLGLVWLVVNYIAGPNIAWMNALGSWNFLIGFALIVIGLLMTMRWR